METGRLGDGVTSPSRRSVHARRGLRMRGCAREGEEPEVGYHRISNRMRTTPTDLSWMGATLDERIAHVERSRSLCSQADAREQIARTERLAGWRRACAEGDERAFRRRLSWDDIAP